MNIVARSPSTQKQLQMKIWGFIFAFRFRNGKTINFPWIFFSICFRNDHVGQAQTTTAGHTYEKQIKSKRFSFAFAFVIRKREILNPGICIFFACNCFCEDGIEKCRIHGSPPQWVFSLVLRENWFQGKRERERERERPPKKTLLPPRCT